MLARAVVLAAVGLGAPALAHADHEKEAEAEALFDQGMQDLAAKNLDRACPELAASLARRPDIATAGALAESATQAGNVATAWRLWTDLAASAPTAALQAEAAGNAKKLEARRPRVTVTRPAAPPEVTVTLGGVRLDPQTVPLVDPGAVEVVASAPGYPPWRQTVQAVEAQPLVIVIPALVALAPPSLPPPPRARRVQLDLRAGLQRLTPRVDPTAQTRAGATAGGTPQGSTSFELALVARVPLAVGGDTVLDHLRVGAGLGYRAVKLTWDCNTAGSGPCVLDTSPTYVTVPVAVQGFVRWGDLEVNASVDGTVGLRIGGSFIEDGTTHDFSSTNTSAVALDLGARLGVSRAMTLGRVFADIGYRHSLVGVDTNGLDVGSAA